MLCRYSLIIRQLFTIKLTGYNLAKTLTKFANYHTELSDEEWEELGIPSN